MNCSLAFVNLSLQNFFTMSNDFVSGFFTFLASTASTKEITSDKISKALWQTFIFSNHLCEQNGKGKRHPDSETCIKSSRLAGTLSKSVWRQLRRYPISHLVSDIPALNALCRICSPHEPTSINLLLKSFPILSWSFSKKDQLTLNIYFQGSILFEHNPTTREGTKRGESEKDKLGQISLMLMKSYSSLQDKNKIFNTLHMESYLVIQNIISVR